MVPADHLFVARLVRMMVMPAMAVLMSGVVVTFVMIKLPVMIPMRVGMGAMVMSLVKSGGALDLPKFGMQHHGHLKRLQVRHG